MLGLIFETVTKKINQGLLRNTKRNFHDMMLDKIMNAPINLYFDVTPISRIVKHF